MFKNFRITIWLIMVWLCPLVAMAEVDDAQLWWIYTTTGSFYQGQEKTRYKYWFDGHERYGDDYRRSSQWLVRPGLGYALDENFSLWLGAAYIDTNYPYARIPVFERRLWQQLLRIKKYAQLSLTSRTRLEQRFIGRTSTTGWRLRELVKVVSPLKSHPNFSIVGSNELFWHHRNATGAMNNGLDQNRFFMGMGYKISSAATLEIGYLNQFIYRRGGDNLLANIIATNFIVNLT